MTMTVKSMKTGSMRVFMLSLLIGFTQGLSMPPCFMTVCPIRKYCTELGTGETECRDCQRGCLTCGSPVACFECEPGYQLQNYLCYDRCKDHSCDKGHHCALREDSIPYCSQCHQSCDKCYGPSPAQCFDCNNGFTRENFNCLNDRCKDQRCDEGQHCALGEDDKPYCSPCHKSCDRCYGPKPTQCSRCSIGYELLGSRCYHRVYPPEIRKPPCFFTECPIRKYCTELGTGDTECRDCQEGCLRCGSPVACFECEPGYKLLDHICYDSKTFILDRCKGQPCDEGHHCALREDGRPYCSPCHQRCDKCYGPGPAKCFDCNYGYILRNSTCLNPLCKDQSCDEDHHCARWEDGRPYCSPCHMSCDGCYGPKPTQCFRCSIGYELQGSSCMNHVPGILDCDEETQKRVDSLRDQPLTLEDSVEKLCTIFKDYIKCLMRESVRESPTERETEILRKRLLPKIADIRKKLGCALDFNQLASEVWNIEPQLADVISTGAGVVRSWSLLVLAVAALFGSREFLN